MPLSPFGARLAVAGFLVVCGGIATNLLAWQGMGDAPGVGPTTEKSGSERRGGTVRDAGSGVVPPAPTQRASTSGAPRQGAGETRSPTPAQRVGSFSPSAGALARTAMPGADPAEARRATVRSIQAELARRGYDPGAPDGAVGLITRAAVLAYEHDQGLPLTADPSPEVLAHLRHGTSAPGVAIGLDGEATPPAMHAEAVIRSIQQLLGALGYLAATPDGQMSDETVRAIREFEMDAGLVPTGRISAPLVARLSRQVGRRAGG
jgi:peptidoglycan hydrolase-like protein with peptidoglycan-binding domain